MKIPWPVPVRGVPGVVAGLGLAILAVSLPLSVSGMQIGLAAALFGFIADLKDRRTFPRTAIDLPVLLFLLLTLLSALLSGDPQGGLRQFIGSWTVAALYLAACYGVRDSYLEKFLAMLFVPAAAVALYALFQHFSGLDFIRPDLPLMSLELGERLVYFPRGAFSHYQTFANVFYLLFCIAFAMALHHPRRRARRIWTGMSLAIGPALILSYTRGVWIATLFAVILTTLALGRKAAKAAAAAVAATALIVFLSLPNILSRAGTVAEVEQNVERFLLWETTWNMIRDYPRLGVGVGNYQRVQSGYVRDEVAIPMTRSHSHNNLLQVTVERGLFGLFLFIWIWYGIVSKGFGKLWKYRKERGYSFALLLGCVTGALGFFLDGMFQNNFGDTEVIILFWFMAGLIFRAESTLPEASPEVRG